MTQLPWFLQECSNGGKILVRGGGIHGAHIQTHVQILPVEDAFLMAAAPELLKALEWAMAILDGYDPPIDAEPLARYEAGHAHARAAIRKAKEG